MTSDHYQLSIPIDRGEIRLPCNSQAILQLFTEQICGGRSVELKKLFELLISDPALLVFAVSQASKKGVVRLRDLRTWFQQIDEWSDLQLHGTLDSPKGVKRFFKQLASVDSSRRFWKSVRRYVNKQRESGKFRLRPKQLPVLSDGVLKRIRKSATRMLATEKVDGVGDFHRLLTRLGEIQKLQNDFDGELLRQKLDSMRLLAYGASHEINNPLANVATRAQSLLQDESDPTRRHRLSVIYEQAMRAHEMISDMMLYAHPPKVELGSMDLAECVRSVVRELEPKLTLTKIQCEFSGRSTLIIGDETKLASAIKSLLVNAIEAIGSEGLIKIALETGDSNEVRLLISDSGPGIDPEIGANIFDPFFSGREAGRGLGFGLSKVWRIVEMHEGEVERGVSSLGGARFVIRFSQRLTQLHADPHELAAA